MVIFKEASASAGCVVNGNKIIVPDSVEKSSTEYLENISTNLDSLHSEFLAVNDESYQTDSIVEKEKKEKTLTKTIGTMSNFNTNNSGFSNWFNLLLFLSIDIVAIIVGIYFLLG